MEELAAPTLHHVEQRIHGGEPADSPAIPLLADEAKETVRVASNHRLEHLPVLALDPSEEIGSDWIGIAKTGTHVGQVGPGNKADRLFLSLEEIAQHVEEVLNLWVNRGRLSAEDPFVERAAQEREDADGARGTDEVLEEDDLELDGMLCPMGNVVHSQDIGRAPLQFFQQLTICGNRAERCCEVFRADGKGLGGSGMGRPEDDVQFGVGPVL